jgi:hypothetical protein
MKYKPKMVGETEEKPNFVWPYILLHPNIPKPLHGLNPRTILGEDWWNITRQEAYKKNNYCCWACGVHKSKAKYHQWLEAHECYEIDYKTGKSTLKMVAALCHSCHNYVHSGRMNMMLEKGEITRDFFIDICNHGDHLTDSIKSCPEELVFLQRTLYNLAELKTQKIATVKWEDWRLILDGKEYKPIHKTYDDWVKFYHE